MEIRKTNLHLAYKIEEKPGGGFIARSEDPGVESIEAATKVELFQKMRDKSAELIGKEMPLDAGTVKTADFNIGGANFHLDRKFSVKAVTPSSDPQPNANWVSNSDTQLASQGSSGAKLWKILFFALLAFVIGWFFAHR